MNNTKDKKGTTRAGGSLINKKKLDRVAGLFRSMSHPMRLSIINLLDRKKRLNVTDIYETLSLEQAVASHHLGILREHGVLVAEREGKKIFYTIDREKIALVQECLDKVNNN